MASELDTVLDQRLLRRRLWRWRLISLSLLVVLAGFLISLRHRDADHPGLFGNKPHIARIDITGLITEDRKMVELLKKLGDDNSAKAVILAIDSPGGTTTGGEVLYNAVSELAKKKPVVAVGGTIDTSAAYMISVATDHIVVHGNTITGSVGVIFEYPQVDEGLAKLGITMHEIRSGPLKAVPSMFGPLDDKGKALAEGLVHEGEVWFQNLVNERRHIAPADVPGMTDGSIYSGRQALIYKLVDEIGGEDEAIAWLEKEKGVAAKLPILDRKPQRPPAFGLFGASDAGAQGGLGAVAQTIIDRMIGRADNSASHLDGLLSLWQVGPN